MHTDTSAFRVGIVWAGSPAHPDDRKRSTNISDWLPLLRVPGVTWVSLQVGCTNEAELFAEVGVPVVPCDTLGIKTFSDSAYVLSQLDLVISVDTAIVHLAGAMGVPCWVLVAVAPDWRWGLDHDTTPWYDSVRLFRQKRALDWTGPITEAAKQLRNLLNQRERKAA